MSGCVAPPQAGVDLDAVATQAEDMHITDTHPVRFALSMHLRLSSYRLMMPLLRILLLALSPSLYC